jgi:hypothetical protein
MAFADPMSVTIGADTLSAPNIAEGNHTSEYYVVNGVDKFTASVKHTIPQRGKYGESHMIRFDYEDYDASGVLLGVASAWLVVRTDLGPQNTTLSENVAKGLIAFMTAANVTKLVGRQV